MRKLLTVSRDLANKAFVGRCCLCQRAEEVGQRRPAESTAGRRKKTRKYSKTMGLRSVRSSVIQVIAAKKGLHVGTGGAEY